MTITFLVSCFIFYEVALVGNSCYIEFFSWFNSELLNFSWGFLFDTLTAVMLVVVTSISMCVHWYSTEYMATDPHLPRFMAYLSLFTFFMLLLITADNFFQLFLGWEGVGLCSYLLVNFWYGRLHANKAALKAVFVNRIGDMALALGIFLIYYVFKTLDYTTIFCLIPFSANYNIFIGGGEINVITLICLCFFIAATGKSAQVGLHTWLPDAMEGPTPVSALIHAATMVTAGIFLIVRCSPIFEYTSLITIFISISGAMTAFIAASIGLVQNDLKRVIAYSTCSQLGYMMIACGTSGYNIGIFHLTNHAFFKALLFLSAGAIIHAIADEQDMRKMGGLLNLLPLTYAMLLIGSLSLMGFPFLTGFYSKDLILEWTFSQFSINGLFAYWLGSLSAFFTAFYSWRVICLTFLKTSKVSKIFFYQVHEIPLAMALPLGFLAIFSIFIGYFIKDMFVGFGTNFWGTAIFILPIHNLLMEAEFLPVSIKLFPVFLSLTGGLVAFVSYNFFFKFLFFFKLAAIGRNCYIFLNRKWFFDKIYNYWLVQYVIVWGYRQTYQNLDRGLFEFFGPTGIWFVINYVSLFLTSFYNFFFLSIKKIQFLFKFLFFFLSVILGFLLISYFSNFNTNFFLFLQFFQRNFNLMKYLDTEAFWWDFLNNIERGKIFIVETKNILSGHFIKQSNLQNIFFWQKQTFTYFLGWDIKKPEIIAVLHGFSPLAGDYFGLAAFFYVFELSIYPLNEDGLLNYLMPFEGSVYPEITRHMLISFINQCEPFNSKYINLFDNGLKSLDLELIHNKWLATWFGVDATHLSNIVYINPFTMSCTECQ